jgi:hypothetical protein
MSMPSWHLIIGGSLIFGLFLASRGFCLRRRFGLPLWRDIKHTTVRYLAGNPWSAVTDPVTITREVEVQVERGLTTDLQTRVRAELDARRDGKELGGLTPTEEEARQWRIARAANLLMGNSGVRRDEAANARRENLSLAVVTATGASSTES